MSDSKFNDQVSTNEAPEDKNESPKNNVFEFPTFDNDNGQQLESNNKISISIEEEDEDEEEKFEFPRSESPDAFNFSEFPPMDGTATSSPDAFQFSFDDFKPDQQDDQAVFTFDANDKTNANNEEEQLYQKFVTLISNPCFEYKGKPLEELFHQDDETESVDAAYDLLVKSF
ncbi:hypothetical protein TRFO_42804 [Tritrichomonas foetus]|uniref:Uncharacterized protein n=1 Tax=Tritrichomonas foetus TaxID=1144522 RepID=A0A1J4KZ11_9EUKA|nr:hypothetical protein TRFO_42804 [Tritrichomonas foetus]|eukprot:OHT14932.1 hypothetical protein TRFO_42804 [Tritrichomonas foetus]